MNTEGLGYLIVKLINGTLFISNLLLKCITFLLWPKSIVHQDIRSVVIYRIGNLGDTICALPTIKLIRDRFPKAHLTLVTSSGTSENIGAVELLKHAPWIDEIFEYKPSKGSLYSSIKYLLLKLRNQKIDLWIDLPVQFETLLHQIQRILFAKFCGARKAFGWERDIIRIFKKTQSEHQNFPYERDRLLEILKRNIVDNNKRKLKKKFTQKPLSNKWHIINSSLKEDTELVGNNNLIHAWQYGGKKSKHLDFGLPITSDHRKKAKSFLKASELNNLPLVAIAPGAKRATNEWPLSRFIDIALLLVESGHGIIIVGGEKEREDCEKIALSCGKKGKSTAGEFSLLESMAMLNICKFCLCVDSGVQHMANAVNTPTVSIFSARDFPKRWWPNEENNIVLRRRIDCEVCLLEHCPKENACMKSISVGAVKTAINRLERDLTIN